MIQSTSPDKLCDSSKMNHFGWNSNDAHKYVWSKIEKNISEMISEMISETERGTKKETENTEKQEVEPRDKHEWSQLGLLFAELSTLRYWSVCVCVFQRMEAGRLSEPTGALWVVPSQVFYLCLDTSSAALSH